MNIEIKPIKMISPETLLSVMHEGAPYIPQRGLSDYWIYITFYGSSSFIAYADGNPAGAVVAFRTQDNPAEGYIQDMVVRKEYRGCGIAGSLFQAVEKRLAEVGVERVWLSTKINNPAVRIWPKYGFTPCKGDFVTDGIEVKQDFKGPGEHRAVFDKELSVEQ